MWEISHIHYEQPFARRVANILHYVACWTEIDGIYSCGHEHWTIEEALGCLVPDGRTFIRARDHGVLRSLNERETEKFFRELPKWFGVRSLVSAGKVEATGRSVRWRWWN